MCLTRKRLRILQTDGFYSVLKNGAQGRIRTTDTGIFNEDGSVLLFNYSGLCGTFFGVRKSVFFAS